MLGSTVTAGIASGNLIWDLSQADAALLGESIDELSGNSVSSAGDINGDGLTDLLIGAPRYVGSSSFSSMGGATYLLLSPY